METNAGQHFYHTPQDTVVVKRRGWIRRLLAFIGPAYLVSVGYMDPGNWATDIEGGARFGYSLIWVLLMSNLMAVLLQTLSARLGVVTGRDLAQGCREEYPKLLKWILWVLAEIAIAATDLAEALGTILGLNLLFGLPLLWGCLVTACDTFLLLLIQRLGIRKMEAFIVLLVATIGMCFLIEVFLAKPNWPDVANGFIPRLPAGALFVAIGIIGATVMPHNLYLHSSLVQSRAISNTLTAKSEACRFNFIDSVVALNAAFFVNAAILVMAAANFFTRQIEVTQIGQAHQLLEHVLGSTVAPIAFAVALLAAGQSSTLTGTLSGQIVMEGFLELRMQPWLRRLLTRSLALLPAVIVIAHTGEKGSYQLLIWSQVILGMQLPFAIIPLVQFTSDRRKMGAFANSLIVVCLAWIIAVVIVTLNLKLVWEALNGWIIGQPLWHLWVSLPPVAGFLGVLGYLVLRPWLAEGKVWPSGLITEAHKISQTLQPAPYQHLCVALEHSAGDALVISAALSIAQPNRAKITLLHVVDTPGSMVFGSATQSLHSAQDEAYLDALAREIEDRHQLVETLLCYGQPAEQIIQAVKDQGFDFLVLGSHGHRGLMDLIYGQTVTSVRHKVTIPVLVVRSEGAGGG